MASWVIQRGGYRLSWRGWRPASGGYAEKYKTQGEAQEALHDLLTNSLAALGGKVEVKESNDDR